MEEKQVAGKQEAAGEESKEAAGEKKMAAAVEENQAAAGAATTASRHPSSPQPCHCVRQRRRGRAHGQRHG